MPLQSFLVTSLVSTWTPKQEEQNENRQYYVSLKRLKQLNIKKLILGRVDFTGLGLYMPVAASALTQLKPEAKNVLVRCPMRPIDSPRNCFIVQINKVLLFSLARKILLLFPVIY